MYVTPNKIKNDKCNKYRKYTYNMNLFKKLRRKKHHSNHNNKNDNDNTKNEEINSDISDDVENTVIHTCMKCHKNLAKHLRTFDYTKLSQEYFHRPNDGVISLLSVRGISGDDLYPDYWIHLPSYILMTRYPYRVCDDCYETEKNIPLNAWNEWIDI